MHSEYTPEFVARFWARVDKTSSPHGCWLWTGSTVAGGYGQVCFQYRMHYTHRVAYELAFGAIPEGMEICHSCDHLYERDDRTYRRCLRNDGAAHLWLGTRADNANDAANKGRLSGWSRGTGDRNGTRTHPESRPRGLDNPNALLSDSEVEQIRHMRNIEKLELLAIARLFRTSRSNVSRIARGTARMRR